MQREIRKSYGGFRVVSNPMVAPTVKFKGNLEFDCELNIPVRDKVSNYAVDVYYNDSFVMRTNTYPIKIINEQLIYLYEHYEYMKFTFITQRLRGNKQSSPPVSILVQKIKCADELCCSERVKCTEKDTIVDTEDDDNEV